MIMRDDDRDRDLRALCHCNRCRAVDAFQTKAQHRPVARGISKRMLKTGYLRSGTHSYFAEVCGYVKACLEIAASNANSAPLPPEIQLLAICLSSPPKHRSPYRTLCPLNIVLGFRRWR